MYGWQIQCGKGISLSLWSTSFPLAISSCMDTFSHSLIQSSSSSSSSNSPPYGIMYEITCVLNMWLPSALTLVYLDILLGLAPPLLPAQVKRENLAVSTFSHAFFSQGQTVVFFLSLSLFGNWWENYSTLVDITHDAFYLLLSYTCACMIENI